MILMNTEFYKKNNNETIPDLDRVISGYIKAIGQENCGEVLKYDSRKEIENYLGEERRTTVSWYPFKENASILEIGGEFGAITGELCDRAELVIVTEFSLFRAQSIQERYKERKNLKVYVGAIEDIKYPCKFDYIVIMNSVDKMGNYTAMDETYTRMLSYLAGYLKEDGKFLVAEENPYSISECQNPEGVLNPWNHARNLDRKQIEKIMKRIGFPYLRVYYPLPDYRVVGRVYSDECLPTAVEWNCLANYECEDQNFLASNMDLIQRLSDNSMFPFFAPAFFIEAGREDNLSAIEKENVLFDESFELPMLGFDWTQHGYSSLSEAIKKYREDKDLLYIEKKNKSAILKIDQDHDVLEKVHEVELDLLYKLQSVCNKYGLKLYAIYGTLLGVVRNGGMIPGDDDIDVALMREDYDKLLTLQHEFTGEYFLQTPENDDCFFGGYLKLRNRNTAEMHPQNWWVDCCEGICIDIFPLDSGYADIKKERRKQKRIKEIQRLLYAKAYGYFPRFKDMKMLQWKMYKYLGKVYSRKQLSDMLTKEMSASDGSKQAPFGIYAHYLGGGGPRWLDRNAFENSVLMRYEEMLLQVPAGWDNVLKKIYGEKYMEPRSWVEWKTRHGFYSTKEHYSVYKRRFRGLFRPEPDAGRKIVLFGDGYLFDAYFDKYKEDKYKPDQIVLLFGENVIKNIHGVKVKTMEEFVISDKENIYPVICSVDVRVAEQKMQEFGFEDYYIFMKIREWMLYANPTFILHELGDN